jgi:hypothetical protein
MLTEELAQDAEARLLARVATTAAAPPDGFPHAADPTTGRWEAKRGGAWTDGFWVGILWLAHAATGAPRYRAWCYNLHTGEAPDHELIWGDYFLLEALLRWQGRAPG